MSSAKGFQTVYFGILPLPDLLQKNKELGELLESVHTSLNFTLAALVLSRTSAAARQTSPARPRRRAGADAALPRPESLTG
jgi:cytochrome b561